MKNNSKVLINFMSAGTAAQRLLTLADNVTQNMKSNPLFANTAEKVKAVTTAREAYTILWGTATTGTSSQKQAAKAAKASLQTALKELALDINYLANGNRTMVLTTGYSIRKENTARQVLGAITGLYVNQGVNAGEVIIGFNPQGAIQGTGVDYAYTSKPDNTTLWITVPNGKKSKIILTGLEPGSVLTVRAWATGPRNQTVVSQNVVTVSGFNQTAKKGKVTRLRTAA